MVHRIWGGGCLFLNPRTVWNLVLTENCRALRSETLTTFHHLKKESLVTIGRTALCGCMNSYFLVTSHVLEKCSRGGLTLSHVIEKLHLLTFSIQELFLVSLIKFLWTFPLDISLGFSSKSVELCHCFVLLRPKHMTGMRSDFQMWVYPSSEVKQNKTSADFAITKINLGIKVTAGANNGLRDAKVSVISFQ